MRPIAARFITACAVALAAGVVMRAAQPAAPRAIPPVSMTCPMHPEIVETRPGECPLCKMALVPMRLETRWSCPVHGVVDEPRPGTCRICRRELVPVITALTWTCLGRPELDRLDPGACPDGSAMVPRRTLRPHGNHNPQHGGQFFMASDNRTHVEGVLPRRDTFRLYLYDDYSRPLSPADMRRAAARVVTRETFDPATRSTTEHRAFTLRPAPGGRYLEARIDDTTLPAQMVAKLRLQPDGTEYRFDFAFPSLSHEPAPVASGRAATRTTRSSAPRGSGTASPARSGSPATGTQASDRDATTARAADPVTIAAAFDVQPDPALIRTAIPDATPDLIAQLALRQRQVKTLIDGGNLPAVFVPAFQARDLALALEARLDDLPAEARSTVAPAIQAIVRTAWRLDQVADAGDRLAVARVYDEFAAAVSLVVAAVPQGAR